MLIVLAPAIVLSGGAIGLLEWLAHPVSADTVLDAAKAGFGVGAGIGGLVTLNLAARRQTHSEEAQRKVEFDATERRITDLYAKAADQLGSDKAPVRLAGLYALERLAQDNPGQRQTIVDVLCAYLRMPYDVLADPSTDTSARRRPQAGVYRPLLARGRRRQTRALRLAPTGPPSKQSTTVPAEAAQERQVRLAAQRILARHLRPGSEVAQPGDAYWPDISIDLTGAVLIDFALDGCRLAGAVFADARFHHDIDFDGICVVGDAKFDRAKFGGLAAFGNAEFGGTAVFHGVEFSGDARFDRAHFGGPAAFSGAKFDAIARFAAAAFDRDTTFRKAKFSDDACFDRATFNYLVVFRDVTFGGVAAFRRTVFKNSARFDDAEFSGAAAFDVAEFGGSECASARFDDAAFCRIAQFGKARFHGDARFSKAKFDRDAQFGKATFGGAAGFGGAKFGKFARFNGAVFHRDAQFGDTTFCGEAQFLRAIFGGVVQFGGAEHASDVWRRGFDEAWAISVDPPKSQSWPVGFTTEDCDLDPVRRTRRVCQPPAGCGGVCRVSNSAGLNIPTRE